MEARRAALYYWSGDWARSLSTGLPALDKIPAAWWYLRAYLRVFLGASFQASGDLPQAYATIYASDEPEQGREYQMLLAAWACFMHWVAGDLPGMARAARRVLVTTDLNGLPDSVNWSRFHLGMYYYQCNDLQASERLLLPLVMHPYTSDAPCFLNSAVLLARIRQAQNRPEEARTIVDTMLLLATELGDGPILGDARPSKPS